MLKNLPLLHQKTCRWPVCFASIQQSSLLLISLFRFILYFLAYCFLRHHPEYGTWYLAYIYICIMLTSTCLDGLGEEDCLAPMASDSVQSLRQLIECASLLCCWPPETAGGPPGRGDGGVPHGGGRGGHLDRLQLGLHAAALPHRDPGAPAGHQHRHTCA